MDEALQKLENVRESTNIDEIKLALDRLKREATGSTLKCCIDRTIKAILSRNHTAELFDRIEDLFDFIKDPRNFLDELDAFTENRSLIVPTLMFIHQLTRRFNFEYDQFYSKISITVQKDNCQSEGFLLFLLKAMKSDKINDEDILPVITRLAEASVEVSSNCCVKVLYTIIVILRMHPGLFRRVQEMNQLYILLESFEPVARIARRIFIEAENPQLRPKMVFLENFVFPSFEDL